MCARGESTARAVRVCAALPRGGTAGRGAATGAGGMHAEELGRSRPAQRLQQLWWDCCSHAGGRVGVAEHQRTAAAGANARGEGVGVRTHVSQVVVTHIGRLGLRGERV